MTGRGILTQLRISTVAQSHLRVTLNGYLTSEAGARPYTSWNVSTSPSCMLACPAPFWLPALAFLPATQLLYATLLTGSGSVLPTE